MSIDDELLKLDNQLCFRLYAASRQVTRLYRPLLDELGITYPQYLVLLALWQWELEGDVTQVTVSRISERLLLDAGTLTPLLKRMEEAGWITRTRVAPGAQRDARANQRPAAREDKKTLGKADGREVHIALTRSGRALKKRAAKIPQSLICMPGMPLADVPVLRAGLDRLLAAIDELPSS